MKKALRGCARLSLVAGSGETSNFELLKGVAEVIECITELEHTIW